MECNWTWRPGIPDRHLRLGHWWSWRYHMPNMEPARRRWWSRSATRQRKGDYHLLGWQTLAIHCSSQPRTSTTQGARDISGSNTDKKGGTTAPDRIRKSSPTLLLAGRMRSFRDSMTVDTHQRARAHNKGVAEACRDIKSYQRSNISSGRVETYRSTHLS